MKLLVPVYDLSLVKRVTAAAAAGGHIAAIVNPDSGPGSGTTPDPDWTTATAKLRAAGAQVLFYIGLVQRGGANDGKDKKTAKIQTEIDKYIKLYGAPVGWFFDDLPPYSALQGDRLSEIVAYSGGFTVANRGTSDDKLKGYLTKAVTVIVTWEEKGYTVHQPPAWEATKGARVGAMAVKEPDFKAPLAVARQRNVNLFYATNASDDDSAGGGNIGTWDKLPPYFEQMAKAVSELSGDVPVA